MDYNSMLLERLNCTSNQYLTVLQCFYSTIIGSECSSHSLDATVVCCEFVPSLFKIITLLDQIPPRFGIIIHILVWFVYREVTTLTKDELRFIVMDVGGQYVMMVLERKKHKQFVNN